MKEIQRGILMIPIPLYNAGMRIQCGHSSKNAFCGGILLDMISHIFK